MRSSSKRFISICIITVLVVGLIFVFRNSPTPAEYIQNSGYIFGTEYHITYQSNQDLQQGIQQELNKVDNSLSTFNPKSTLSLINNNQSNRLDTMTHHVIELALSVSNNTDGAFDITVAPLVNAWGFGFKNLANVSNVQIDSIKQFVGFHKISIQDNTLVKDNPQVMLDCSGIAKGYSCDVVARYLESKGVKNYLIEIGGEICAKGVNKKGDVWNVGISNPQDDSTHTAPQNTVSVIKITDTGLATSGNYRNFYYKNGKKYAHTIDPRSGYPVQHSILSSTVIAPTCAEADAYATAFMVLGLDKAKEVLARQHQLKAYFIYTDNAGKYQTWYSKDIIERK